MLLPSITSLGNAHINSEVQKMRKPIVQSNACSLQFKMTHVPLSRLNTVYVCLIILLMSHLCYKIYKNCFRQCQIPLWLLVNSFGNGFLDLHDGRELCLSFLVMVICLLWGLVYSAVVLILPPPTYSQSTLRWSCNNLTPSTYVLQGLEVYENGNPKDSSEPRFTECTLLLAFVLSPQHFYSGFLLSCLVL